MKTKRTGTTESEHTAGDWTSAYRFGADSQLCIVVGDPYARDERLRLTSRVLAHVYPTGERGETKAEAEANGKLMAAAPELLAALEGLMVCFERTGEAWMGDPAMIAARAAVKEARP